MQFDDFLLKACSEAQINLDEKQCEQFGKYYRLLVSWNEKINLTAITDPQEVVVKHMVDSLSAWDEKLFAKAKTLIDVGTGAGFPGLPLKIMYPSLQVTLLDSLKKRVNFLREVASALELEGIFIEHGRAEDFARIKMRREKYDIAVSRAVAPLPVLAEYDLPFVRLGGHFVAMKGRAYTQEVEDAKAALQLLGGRLEKISEVKLPGLLDKRAIIYVKKQRPTAMRYPRRAGLPAKEPLR